MDQTNHFFNLGYGWLCKHCSAADAERKQTQSASRFPAWSNQEKQAASPGLALATWADPSHHVLTCPRCGIHETVRN